MVPIELFCTKILKVGAKTQESTDWSIGEEKSESTAVGTLNQVLRYFNYGLCAVTMGSTAKALWRKHRLHAVFFFLQLEKICNKDSKWNQKATS